MATKKGMLEKAKDAIVGVFTSDSPARKSVKAATKPAKKGLVKKAPARKASAKKAAAGKTAAKKTPKKKSR